MRLSTNELKQNSKCFQLIAQSVRSPEVPELPYRPHYTGTLLHRLYLPTYFREVTSLQTLSVGVARLNKAICDDNTTPLSSMINDLLKIKSEATLLEPVLNSIPSEAAERGVVNNNNLRKHFNTLKQAAFENHAVDEELNGFFQILRSQITLWFHRKDPTGFLIQDSVSNLEQIFDQAESHMNQNDFETAVRILNQMSGEPKRIFGVWLKEARMWLEVRQALDVLLTMSEVRALSVRCLS